MKPVKLVDTTLLEKALDAAALRQQVISNNIANINTPGYESQRVVFESHLKEVMALEKDEDDGWNVASTAVDPEFRLNSSGGYDAKSLRPTIESQGGPLDINQEMGNLAKNQIMYNALAGKISGVYGTLKYIIDNAGR
ncbi:MAG: flagellar basal body rod protein FlgB [Candidatus Xenobium sp.]|jgi:flagellar basal-body rod protein FlgB|nr:flagellar basal body rod protein FlgB [Burkholderiales bacterium]